MWKLIASALLQVIDPINKLIDTVEFDAVFYSLDWHPADHVSFIDNIKQRPIHPTSPVSIIDFYHQQPVRCLIIILLNNTTAPIQIINPCWAFWLHDDYCWCFHGTVSIYDAIVASRMQFWEHHEDHYCVQMTNVFTKLRSRDNSVLKY